MESDDRRAQRNHLAEEGDDARAQAIAAANARLEQSVGPDPEPSEDEWAAALAAANARAAIETLPAPAPPASTQPSAPNQATSPNSPDSIDLFENSGADDSADEDWAAGLITADGEELPRELTEPLPSDEAAIDEWIIEATGQVVLPGDAGARPTMPMPMESSEPITRVAFIAETPVYEPVTAVFKPAPETAEPVTQVGFLRKSEPEIAPAAFVPQPEPVVAAIAVATPMVASEPVVETVTEEQAPVDDANNPDSWLGLLAVEPGHVEAAWQLDRIAAELRERGEHERWVELQLGRVAVEPQAARRAELLLSIARIFEYELNDGERALATLLACYKESPALADWRELERLADACDGWGDVVDELGELLPALPPAVRVPLYRRAERWADVVASLDEQAQLVGVLEARALRTDAAATLAQHLGDNAGAIVRYEALANEAPDDVALLRALEQLYEREGRNQAYLDSLQRRAEATPEPSERAALYRQLALSWEEESGGAARAVAFWEAVLGIEPGADDALRALERMHREARNWPALIETLRRRSEREAVAVPLLTEIGGLYERELADLPSAISAYLAADTLEPDGEAALALSRLYELTGEWGEARALLDRLAMRREDPDEKVALLVHAAELCSSYGDLRAAEARYVGALELEPAHWPSLKALIALYRGNNELLRAAKWLVAAVEHAPNIVERTRLLVEGGLIYEQVDQAARAIELYLEGLTLDPEHAVANEHAAELLWQARRHEELIPLLETLLRRGAELPLQLERWVRLGQSAEAVGEADKAIRAYARAAELDATNLLAQTKVAQHHFAREQWARALVALERIFQHHVDRLPPTERLELLSNMGRCELMLGSRDRARELTARALEIDMTHRPSLLTQMQINAANPEAQIDAMKALLVTASAEEQVRLLDQIGDLYLSQIGDSARAVGAWAEALELTPRDHRLLHKCLDVFVEDRAWVQAVEMLDRLIEIEPDVKVRAKYRHTAGLICRDELNRPAATIAYLRAALDDDPDHERTSDALVHLYGARQEWKELQRLYRKRLERLGQQTLTGDDADGRNGQRLQVWTRLGELCWTKLGDRDNAVAAFEAALSFDRDNLERHKQLADLYVQAGAHLFPRAIAEHHHVLRHEKSRVLSYRALKHLYIQTDKREQSLLLSCALMILKKGEPDDPRRVAEYQQRRLTTARGVLRDEGWARIMHPSEDRLLDMLFAIIGPTIVANYAQPHKAFGLSRKDAIPLNDPHSYNKALRYVTATFDVPMPEAYARPEQKEPIAFANCIDGRTLAPAFVLGAPLLSGRRRERALVFEVARRAAHLRPERLLRLAMPSAQPIGGVIEAAMEIGAGADDEALSRVALGLKRALPPWQLEQVVALGQKLIAAGTRAEDAARAWLQASDLTALRAGWLLSGDLETCARIVANDGLPTTTLPPTQRLLELVWSTTTEDLFNVRRQLGLV